MEAGVDATDLFLQQALALEQVFGPSAVAVAWPAQAFASPVLLHAFASPFLQHAFLPSLPHAYEMVATEKITAIAKISFFII
jgi:hypothetical protein